MNEGLEILSEITIFTKYAKWLPKEKRRETWDEIVSRYILMMCKKYPFLTDDILINSDYIYKKKVLPSMRALQFAGEAAEVNNARMYNCCYMPIDSIYSFSETMFLLLSGTGVGYSVQKHHVAKLPLITVPTKHRRFLIEDNIMGWADAVKALMKAYMAGKPLPIFDYRAIRAKGMPLVTSGGKAPGPEPLKLCLAHVQAILERKKEGEQLSPLECHDIQCHLANAVLAGGIRRAAMISLFSLDDEEMLTCKYGNWWETNEQRGRSNNSAIILRGSITEEEFKTLWKKIEASGSGEPGVYWTNDLEQGTNPCCFVGNTKLLTSTGYREIKDLLGDNELLNKDGQICNGLVWSNGVKPVIELTLSNKKKIKCTEDHRFMLVDGSERQAKDIKNERILSYYQLNEEVSEFTKYGFIQGDGGLGRLKSSEHKGLEIYIGDKDEDIFELLNIQKEEGKRSYYTYGYNEIFRALRFDSDNLLTRGLPATFMQWDRKDQLMFFKGMFSANGSITKGTRISYKTSSKKLAFSIVEQLEYFGISSYITTNKEKEIKFSNGNYVCKESYDINIGKLESIIVFTEKIGFVHGYKKEALVQLIKAKSPKVISLKDAGEEEVFDFSLDDSTHWGVIEGVIAHNCEVALKAFQFCNLCEINVSDVESQEDLNKRAYIAAFFGTLQAGFTDFHYLRPIWKRTTEEDALIGIGMTGIASGEVLKYDLEYAADFVYLENQSISEKIGINSAARQTLVKPSGTTSCVLGTSSGIHGWHDNYYLRTMRFGKGEDIASYLIVNHPEIVEDDVLRPHDTICVRIPIKAPEGAILRYEIAIDLLERVKKFSVEWIKPGHISGVNSHNVSATISIDKDRIYGKAVIIGDPKAVEEGFTYDLKWIGKSLDEWEAVGNWMWENKEFYNGLSVLPHNGGTYFQAPFESITEEEYNKRVKSLSSINLKNVLEYDDVVNFGAIISCGGGACEVA